VCCPSALNMHVQKEQTFQIASRIVVIVGEINDLALSQRNASFIYEWVAQHRIVQTEQLLPTGAWDNSILVDITAQTNAQLVTGQSSMEVMVFVDPIGVAVGAPTLTLCPSISAVVIDAVAQDITYVTGRTAAQIVAIPDQLTFTSLNWMNPQEIVVSAVDDDIYEGLLEMSLIHVVTSPHDDSFEDDKSIFVGEAGINAREVAVAINDDDAAYVNISACSLEVGEGSHSSQYVVQLNSDPKASVTIHVHGTSEVGVQPEILFSPQWILVFHRL